MRLFTFFSRWLGGAVGENDYIQGRPPKAAAMQRMVSAMMPMAILILVMSQINSLFISNAVLSPQSFIMKLIMKLRIIIPIQNIVKAIKKNTGDRCPPVPGLVAA
jgi:hypothetical protein